MTLSREGKLLRVFIGEADKWEGKPLYEAIVLLAKEKKMAGATAIKGFLGFGAKSHMHTAKILRLSEDLPVIVELVDTEDKINAFMPHLDNMVRDGLITLEKADVIMYRADK